MRSGPSRSGSVRPGANGRRPTAGRALPLLAAGTLAWLAACAKPAPDAETVVVVHGLGRTSASMSILAARLNESGYRVVEFDYPSTSESLEQLTGRLGKELDRCCSRETEGVHFVTHSMGGILVWAYLSERPAPHRGRVVMLSPPARGSEVVDALSGTPLLEPLLGPAGARLGTDSAGAWHGLPPAGFELGVITGDRSLNPLTSWIIPGPDDGQVGVEAARAEGATDFLVLPATHTFIMNRGDVAEEVVHFLRHGTFTRTAD